MADLNTLRIERGGRVGAGKRRRRWIVWAVLGVVVAAAAIYYVRQPRVSAVQAASVVTAYPSQQFVLLNATGYVVAQRKAAVSSKATGRLEWLGVAEGSRVKSGEIIARLDHRDVGAQLDQAAAGVKVAQSSIQQSDAELWEATQSLQRNRDLFAKGFISQAVLDSAVARELHRSPRRRRASTSRRYRSTTHRSARRSTASC